MVFEIHFYEGSNFVEAIHWLWDQTGGLSPMNRNFGSKEIFLDWVKENKINWGYRQFFGGSRLRFIFYFIDSDLALRFKLMGF